MQRPSSVPPGTEFVWEQAERRIDAQLRQADALDAKAGILVGIHALAAGLVASVSGGLGPAARRIAAAVLALLLTSGLFAKKPSAGGVVAIRALGRARDAPQAAVDALRRDRVEPAKASMEGEEDPMVALIVGIATIVDLMR